MTTVHPLARAHYAKLPTAEVVLEHPNHFEGPQTFLNLNINKFEADQIRFYPDVLNKELHRQYLAMLPKLSNGATIETLNEKNLLFTTGSLGGIEAVLKAFCEPGIDRVIVTNPTFAYYGYWAQIENLEVIDIPLVGQDLNRLDVARILEQDAKVIFLCNPNNPVGTAIHPDDVKQVLDNFKGIVVMDEAYIEWTDMQTYAQHLHTYENLMITRTFSKAWALAGARVGAVLASEVMIRTLQFPTTRFNLSLPVYKLLQEAISKPELILEYKRLNQINRQRLAEFLKQCPFIDYVYPSVSSYLLFRSKQASAISEYLGQQGLRILDLTRGMADHARISIGTEAQTDMLIECITRFQNQ